MNPHKHGTHQHGRDAHAANRDMSARHQHHEQETASDAVVDPVCGMTVDPAHALVHRLDGEPHYFCSAGCRDKFAANPAQFLEPADAKPAASTTSAAKPNESPRSSCPARRSPRFASVAAHGGTVVLVPAQLVSTAGDSRSRHKARPFGAPWPKRRR